MTLGFKTHIDGKPTFFIDKIWWSFPEEIRTYENWEYKIHVAKKFTATMSQKMTGFPKIHTIREDKHDRWKVGMNIHFVINNRTKDRFQFAPVIPVTEIQTIKIDHQNDSEYPIIHIDSKRYCPIENHFDYFVKLDELSQNDGFDTIKQFLDYFKEDFEGKIIHWTDFKY